ncbi:AMP-binding protein [Betaproteobacteria bacterium]|nr:AMP-binding protein [Betaproteobacteria bacterium]GHU43953.1 AMP-binding protein [Betaproteobacteria bacterium]
MSDILFPPLQAHWPLPTENAFPIAYRGGVAISREQFRADLLQARQALFALQQPAIALFEPDAYVFVVWLLAAWSLHMKVVLPGEDLASTRDFLGLPWVGKGSGVFARSDWNVAVNNPVHVFDHAAPGLAMFTSGSSGEPSLIEKTLTQLRNEVEAQEQAFRDRLPAGVRFIRSVPHHHMFGLPFSVLWPLTFGHVFVAEKLVYPEDFSRLPAADYVLISAPTFLKHLAASKENFAASQKVKLAFSISAGSPLPADIQRVCEDFLHAPFYDSYGSTETGAVAYRQGEDAAWILFPGVRVSVDAETSRLRIHSPFLAPEMRETGFLSGDLARMEAASFKLMGRADRMVKIGEKRLSLTRVEDALKTLPEVERGAVILLSGKSGAHSRRDVLGAVVILSPAGVAQKETLGKARFDRYLRRSLVGALDPLALPRRWRYVSAMPGNAMGKTTRRDLERLFAPQLPEAVCQMQEESDTECRARLQLYLAPEIIWFEGHFPHLPVLPGVVQVDWAAHFGQLHFGFTAPAGNVTGLKFQQLLRPGDAPCLELRFDKTRQTLEFSYHLKGTPCSKGVLHLRADQSA